MLYLHPMQLNDHYDFACWSHLKDVAGDDMADFSNAYDGCAFE